MQFALDEMLRQPLLFCIVKLVFVFLFFISISAQAQESEQLGSVTLVWIAPTENEDGSPLTDLAGFMIYWGTESGVYPNSIRIEDPAKTTYLVENLPTGTYEFVATAFNAEGIESRFSDPTTRFVHAGVRPAPPEALSVADLTVYTIVKQTNRFVLLPVGTVPIGTSCIPEQNINGMYVVNRDSVQWTGTVQPLVVVADCQ